MRLAFVAALALFAGCESIKGESWRIADACRAKYGVGTWQSDYRVDVCWRAGGPEREESRSSSINRGGSVRPRVIVPMMQPRNYFNPLYIIKGKDGTKYRVY